ncbi:MAG: hypothetical protein LBU32_25640 [Clostridiales bacterium]|nr:hypothetical protein [Clostridiales bacterium]
MRPDKNLGKLFGAAGQSMLVEVLGRTIKVGRTASLIRKYPNASAATRHSFRETTEGVPQGGL